MPPGEAAAPLDLVSASKYNLAVEEYAPDTVSFHPAILSDEEQLFSLADRPSTLLLDGIPVWLDVSEAPELVEVTRSLQIAERAVPGAEEHGVKFALVPAGYIIDHASEIRQETAGTSAPAPLVFAEYDGPLDQLQASASAEGVGVHELIHPALHTSAGLNLYQTVVSTREQNAGEPLSVSDTVKAQRVPRLEALADGGTLETRVGGDFAEHEKSQMWELFKQRFTDISDNMPSRLEESEEATRTLLEDPNYVFTYRRDSEQKIICAAFIADNPDAYPWISQEFTSNLDGTIEAETGQQPYEIFVPGIAAYKRAGVAASRAVLGRLIDVAVASEHPLLAVRFECTDVSSLYVPRIVNAAGEAHNEVIATPAERKGEKHYVLLDIPPAGLTAVQ
jgi:hypothetical protein